MRLCRHYFGVFICLSTRTCNCTRVDTSNLNTHKTLLRSFVRDYLCGNDRDGARGSLRRGVDHTRRPPVTEAQSHRTAQGRVVVLWMMSG